MNTRQTLCLISRFVLPLIACVFGLAGGSVAQEAADLVEAGRPDRAGAGRIVIETHGDPPAPTPYYSATAAAVARVTRERVEQTIEVAVSVIQGDVGAVRFELNGGGEVVSVEGEEIQSWSVRRRDGRRFLELEVKTEATAVRATIVIRSAELKLPATINLTHLGPGDAVGFDSRVRVNYAAGVGAVVARVDGFAPLESAAASDRFQTSTGGQITLSLNRGGGAPAPVELTGTTLVGEVHPNGDSARFRLRTTAVVSEADAEVALLTGHAAVSRMPRGADHRVRLVTKGERPAYVLSFRRKGKHLVELDFVAAVERPSAAWRRMDFTVAAGAVVPLKLSGLDGGLEFHHGPWSVVPARDGDAWSGFLPANGRAQLQWKPARETGEGKLFFTTTGRIKARLGAGLLRQDHVIEYKVLQGELRSLSLLLRGPGDIVGVEGEGLVGWKVTQQGDDRRLEVALSQPITSTSSLRVRSQTPLDAFPVRVEGLRLNPVGAIRHSGHLRLTNRGSVRLEPTGLVGLTQLSPDQFPGKASSARQAFVYRFPAADHAFGVAADRIQPEVNVSQLLLYRLAETDRVINADIELDIREAPIREWDVSVPADYSVVSVTGAGVADYVADSRAEGATRNLRVMFADELAGRQLIRLHLEKNAAAAEGPWTLPRIAYPGAKSVRGDLGVVAAPGFRVAIAKTDQLTEQTLSYFPKPVASLQQAFRVRGPDWSATMRIEPLEQSVQSDVFHLYSLSQGTVYGSALVNYFVTGAPVSEWRLAVPASLGNIVVDGQDVRAWRREGEVLVVSLHQPVIGPYTLLLTFEEEPAERDGEPQRGTFQAGVVAPLGVQGERGYVHVVSPMLVELNALSASDDLLKLDPLELPAELRLLSTAPPLGTWQYTQRPFNLSLQVQWFQTGETAAQVVEFSEAKSRVSRDGELVTDLLYYVKSRGQRTLRLQLPAAPVRLWEVSVAGRPVTARQAGDATLIPLPGDADPNAPVEVRLRLGKPAVSESRPVLTLPRVSAPVLKTVWDITGDAERVLVPTGGTVDPPEPVLRPQGYAWVAERGLLPLVMIGVLTGVALRRGSWAQRGLGLAAVTVAVCAAGGVAGAALLDTGPPTPLRLSVPVLSAEDVVQIRVTNTPLWRANLSWLGVAAILAGLYGVAHSVLKKETPSAGRYRKGGALAIGLGVLSQRDGAPWFFVLLALALIVFVLLPILIDLLRDLRDWREASRQRVNSGTNEPKGPGAVATLLLVGAATLFSASNSCLAAPPAGGFESADSITQAWQITHTDNRLTATGSLTVTGRPGDRFLLLKAPAILTRFEGEGLRVTKQNVPGCGLAYVVSIPLQEETPAEGGKATEQTEETRRSPAAQRRAVFDYRLEALTPAQGVSVLTGAAAVQELTINYDQAGWEVVSPNAVRVETLQADAGVTRAKAILGPGDAVLRFRPKARDVSQEATRFFVEASNLYLPRPGVVDGRHRLHVRTSQGRVRELSIRVPPSLTVSDVRGPIGSWQFDAESGRLKLQIEPAPSRAFDVFIDTQRGLAPLPAEVGLEPLRVAAAQGEVGLIAVAFGPDTQPEQADANGLSAVNLGDFDPGLLTDKRAVLHRVYRYGADGGALSLRVAPVAPEVRVASKQVLSFGDERIVMGVNFVADISRAGLFRLSFPLPDGLEVESLTGAALHHWAELEERGERKVVLHLNGKTIGRQAFSLTLTGAAPADANDWRVPRFELAEATRQTGDLVVQPSTGIRLRTVARQNVSEADPRTIGGRARGALAYRLLQRDWGLTLGVEKLQPWVTGQVLHDVTLREGQTRSTLHASFDVQNASIRNLRIVLPITDEDEAKTLRATGKIVSDLVRVDPASNVWEVRFKRRVVERIQFRIEHERRGERPDDGETLRPVEFPGARQLSYYLAVRAGGRLEIEPGDLPRGWERADWGAAPQALRNAANRNAPALTLRLVAPDGALRINARRHALAGVLKLRVTKGTLTTVLSPTGGQLTAADLTMEVIQRRRLTVQLPPGGELFSIFVNDESVHSVRQGRGSNAWRFHVLPGIDDRTAKVRFVYSLPGGHLDRLAVGSPRLDVPLEDIEWNVIAPEGFVLNDNHGNLELTRRTLQQEYDREFYLSKVSSQRSAKAEKATTLLETANRLLQAGEQKKANRALNSVANQYALDAASNEDARVQLKNLQTQQAVVGLNTRRQRFYLDNRGPADAGGEQLLRAATDNPVLQQDALNFRPQQMSQLLQGNTSEGNAVLQRIASRLVQHQRTTEPAPRAIAISLPQEGSVYTFARSVQVAENAPLELSLGFHRRERLPLWRSALVLAGVALLVACLTSAGPKR